MEKFSSPKSYLRSSGILPMQRFAWHQPRIPRLHAGIHPLPQRDVLENPFKNQSFISSEAMMPPTMIAVELPGKVGMEG